MPLPGPGATWFQIDVLGFDQQFLSVLWLIASCLALAGMVLLRPLMARRSIAYVVVLLTIAAGILSLPSIGLYYGVQDWTARWTGGVVDARFIAIIDTALESPLGAGRDDPDAGLDRQERAGPSQGHVLRGHGLVHQPGALRQQPADQISEPDLRRDARGEGPRTGAVEVAADYGDLGMLLIAVALITVLVPLGVIALVQRSRFRTEQ